MTTKTSIINNNSNYDKLFDLNRQNSVKLKLNKRKKKLFCEYDLISTRLNCSNRNEISISSSSSASTSSSSSSSNSSTSPTVPKLPPPPPPQSIATSVSNPILNSTAENHQSCLFIDTIKFLVETSNNNNNISNNTSFNTNSNKTRRVVNEKLYKSSLNSSLNTISSSLLNLNKDIAFINVNSTHLSSPMPRLNRSKSLNINNNNRANHLLEISHLPSAHTTKDLDLSLGSIDLFDSIESNPKPELHPRSIYLSYDQNQRNPVIQNATSGNKELSTFGRNLPFQQQQMTSPQRITQNKLFPPLPPSHDFITYDNSNHLNNHNTNSIHLLANQNCGMNQADKQNQNRRNQVTTKSHFRSFINKKSSIFKSININHTTTNNSNNNGVVDEFSLFGFRKSITDFIHKPVNIFSLKKPTKSPYTSTSSSSEASNSSGSGSTSASISSIPSSPISRFNNNTKPTGVLSNITNTQMDQFKSNFSAPVQEYECIHDDENERKFISKSKIVDELVQTEMDYFKAMKMLYDVYLGPNSEKTIDYELKETIFCNLKEIVELSSILLNDFEDNILNKCLDNVKIGKCFLKNCDLIKITYSYYAQYKEYSNNILEKNEKLSETHEYIENGLKLIRQNTNAFDLNSLLLKPIQRVLKYPLLLQELIKNTDETHEDYEDLVKALKCMQDVASYINEIKRRHELIVKYGRKDKDNTTITNKMSKLTMHSMIKKSNRISIKLSNVLKINGGISVVTDEKFDKLEEKFSNIEKIIKCFIKDSIQNMSSLKEFLKAQTMCAESLQEYYSEDSNNDILTYVHINANVLNEIFSKNINLVHENVLQPLKSLLKFLEIPNKLIEKRHDKLLDYEFAKSNMEKIKEKYFIKTSQDNLVESRKNYEALNNQLVEEMPNLIKKCFTVFEKCFQIYMISLKNVYKSIQVEISNLIKKHKIVDFVKNVDEPISIDATSINYNDIYNYYEYKLDTLNTKSGNNLSIEESESGIIHKSANNNNNNNNNNSNNNINNNSFNSNYLSYSDLNVRNIITTKFNYSPKMEKSKMKSFLMSNTVMQKIKNLTHSEKQEANSRKLTFQQSNNSSSNTIENQKQDDEIRNRLLFLPKESLYKVVQSFSGFGLTNNHFLEKDDLVCVLKKSDPCGNGLNWFVDNGIVKGLVPSTILKPYDDKEEGTRDEQIPNVPEREDDLENKSIGFKLENSSHSYVNDSSKSSTTKDEICVAIYSFDSISESTLTISEGDKFKVIQKHDDNMNSDWWLLQRLSNTSPELNQDVVGYVPANYVTLLI